MNPAEYMRMFESEDSHWWYVGLHELILRHVADESGRLGRRPRILDAGCGTGRLCQLMSSYGDVDGVDASPEALECCRERGVPATRCDLNDLELEPGSYDIITSIDVLYHRGIRDDVAVLERLRSGLRPGGMLLINLVAHEFLRSTHDVAVHTRERYTIKLLTERLERAGFEIDRITYRVALLFPLIAAYRILAGKFANRSVQGTDVASDVALPHPLVNGLLLKSLRLENRLLATRASLPSGSSLFAVARKPAGGRHAA